MEDKELFNPQTGEKIAPKRAKKFYKDWRFYVYSFIALMLAIVSISSFVTACAAINAGVGQDADASFSVAQKKNAAITTDGGFGGYSFTFDLDYSSIQNGEGYSYTYAIDTTTYEPTLYSDSFTLGDISTFAKTQTFVNERYTASRSATQGDLRFLLIYGRMRFADSGSSSYYNFLYTTFVLPSASSSMMGIKNFVCTNLPSNLLFNRLDRDSTLGTTSGNNYYLLTIEQNNAFVYSSNAIGTSITFQDALSYYQELGYQDGYSDGYSTGYDVGYSNGSYYGYNDGYSEGYADGSEYGYGVGYDAGVAASSTFTSLRLNNKTWYKSDLIATDSTDTSNTYALLRFVDQSSVTWYVNAILSALDDSFVINLYSGGTASNNLYARMFSGTMVYLNDAWQVDVVWDDTYSFTYAQMDAVYSDSINKGYFYINWSYAGTTSYKSGYDAGYSVGRAAGMNEAEPESLTNTLVAVFQQPFNQIYRFFNFNVLGLNILGLVWGLASVFIILKVFRKLLK